MQQIFLKIQQPLTAEILTMFDSCIVELDGAVRLKLHVHPGAKRNGISGVFNNSVKLDLQTPPVDGKANAALLKYLAKLLDKSRSELAIVHGECSRDKVLEIRNSNKASIINILNGNIL